MVMKSVRLFDYGWTGYDFDLCCLPRGTKGEKVDPPIWIPTLLRTIINSRMLRGHLDMCCVYKLGRIDNSWLVRDVFGERDKFAVSDQTTAVGKCAWNVQRWNGTN